MATGPDRRDRASVPERRVRVAAVWVTLTGSLPVFFVGSLAVQIDRDLDVGPSQLGFSTGAFFTSAALGSVVAGRIAERIGPQRAMRIACAISAVTVLAIAAAPTYALLLVALLVSGAGNALAQVGANLLVAKGVDPIRQGWSMALKQAGVPAGALLGGLAVPAVALTVGWRWAFVLAAASAVVAAAVVPDVGRPVRVPGAMRPRAEVPIRSLVLLAASVALAAAANGSLATFLVSAGVDAGFSESTAGLLLTAGAATGISMRLLVGRRADRRGGRHLPVVSALLVGGTIGYLFLVPGDRVTHVIGTAVAFGSGWAWPGLFNLAIVRLNPLAPAAATGITQTGVYIGALSGPMIFGLVVDATDYRAAWVLAAVCSIVAAIGVAAGRKRIIRERDALATDPAVT